MDFVEFDTNILFRSFSTIFTAVYTTNGVINDALLCKRIIVACGSK